MNKSMKQDFISHRQAADLANVHSATLYLWVKAGKLTQYRNKLGKAIYDKSEVLALIKPVALKN